MGPWAFRGAKTTHRSLGSNVKGYTLTHPLSNEVLEVGTAVAPRLALILLFYLRIKRGGRRGKRKVTSVWGSRLILDLKMEKRG